MVRNKRKETRTNGAENMREPDTCLCGAALGGQHDDCCPYQYYGNECNVVERWAAMYGQKVRLSGRKTDKENAQRVEAFATA
jgi:hypothetical protein